MKWLSDNHVYIAVVRRWMGTKKDGILDVYRLYMDVEMDGTIWMWGYLIMPDNICRLQYFIEKGIAAFKKTFEDV